MNRPSQPGDRFSQYLAERVGNNRAESIIYSDQKRPVRGQPEGNPWTPRQNYEQEFNRFCSQSSNSSINSSDICFTSKSNSTHRLSQFTNQRKTITIKKKKLRKLCDIEQNTCSICLEEIHQCAQLSCKHNFCLECLREWLNTSSTCPYCRTDCPFYFYKNQQYLIEQKVFRYEADFPDLSEQQEQNGLDYECYLCERTQEGDTVIICDRCLVHACHPECDSRIRRPLGQDDEWFCHFCS